MADRWDSKYCDIHINAYGIIYSLFNVFTCSYVRRIIATKSMQFKVQTRQILAKQNLKMTHSLRRPIGPVNVDLGGKL